MEIADIISRLIGLILDAVDATQAHELITKEAAARANVIADVAEKVKFGFVPVDQE